MAYVPGFLHDVFISYATADDRADGLIRHLWEGLATELATEGLRIMPKAGGDGVDIFLDRRRLAAGSDLTEQVLSSARSSAVFIAVHSLAYIESSWCMREAEEFCGTYDPKRPELHGRLFVIALGERGQPSDC